MPDREKVIKGIGICLDRFRCSADCPYYDNKLKTGCMEQLRDDAIDLLKEQEIEPKEIVNEHFPIGDYRRTIGWLCGKCGKTLMGDGDYCSYCGKAVKWI